MGGLTLEKPGAAKISPESRALSLPPLHLSRRAVQCSPILGSARRFEAEMHVFLVNFSPRQVLQRQVGHPTKYRGRNRNRNSRNNDIIV